MRRGFLLALCLLALPAHADAPTATSLDVAPTLMRLKPGVPGLFYVTNHGSVPVSVEIQPMDWKQDDERDLLRPSSELFTSPPVVTIAPGARQSVRLLVTPSTPGARAYRLLVSELADPAMPLNNVKVMLQFSVPVFVGGESDKPALAWNARRDGDVMTLSVANQGAAPVKLAAPLLGGSLIAEGPLYVLPGARRSFRVAGAVSLHVTAHDALSGHDIDVDAAAP